MIGHFFIRRPVFAMSLSILLVLAGLVTYPQLPVSQFPDLTPPVVRVTAIYPGASAEVLAETVAAPIEQEVNGVEGMLYMSSSSSANGQYDLDVTFALGVNIDIATVLVQNRVNQAEARLPQEVRAQGVTTTKQSSSFIGVVTLSTTPDATEEQRRTYNETFLSNYMSINVADRVKRVNGVGATSLFPQLDYSMRIWLDPDLLRSRGLTSAEVIDAVRAQNVQVAAGKVGAPPTDGSAAFELAVQTQGRLRTAEEFESIVVRSDARRVVRLKDVARVELGGRFYDVAGELNGRPASVMIVFLAPGANAVATSEGVSALVEEISQTLPPGLQLAVSYDNADFVRAAQEEVIKTLLEAVVLVVLVVLVFLQSFRATLIPILTIPVAIIGTFVFMGILGFSVNTLTLFGLVLAIGIVVDDAIIVVENVERNMGEHHLQPRPATERAMTEITGAVISISLVLMAVFLPTAAVPGLTGQMYKQFAVTIAVSTALSAFNALSLSPALCGLILRPHDPGRRPNIFTRAFNGAFDALVRGYGRVVAFSVGGLRVVPSLMVFVVVLGLTYFAMRSVPSGFLPLEDRGLVMIEMRLPPASSLDRTKAVMARVAEELGKTPGVRDYVTVSGFGLIAGSGSSYGFSFAMLEDWSERLPRGLTLDAIMTDVRQRLAPIKEAIPIVFTLPAIDGIGMTSGFDMRVQDRAGLGSAMLQTVVNDLVAAADAQANLVNVNSSFRAGVPQVFLDIDREKAIEADVPLDTIFNTLAANFGTAYINDFNLFGRTFQVNALAESKYRQRPEDILRVEVRSRTGAMLPLSTLVSIRYTVGPEIVSRYNMFPSATVNGSAAPGVSSGQALELMEQVARETLPPGMGFEWSSLSFQERQTAGQGTIVFFLAIVLVYLILAAQYESWTLPLAVIISVPLVILGAMLLLTWRGLDNNIFTQIGLVLLVGLGAKNAILIVEFARENRRRGQSIVQAARMAAQMRLRPIIMTSLAFIFGCIPLMLTTGAGAAGRVALGTAVVGGMISNTILGLLFVPVLYVAIQGATEWVRGAPSDTPGEGSAR